MNLNVPNNIDNSGFIGNGYSNAQPFSNFDSQFSPPLGFQFETSGLKINISITQSQQELLNNTVMSPNPTEASTSFSYAQCIGNLAQFISPPHASKSETVFESSGFKIKITVVPIFNSMFQQSQQYMIANNPQQQNQ